MRTLFRALDGDDPLDDALPDLAVGRLPVKTEAELVALVEKLIRYDTAPASGSWRGKAVFVADNADGAGDFAAFAELSVAEQPAGIAIERVYYQPSLDARPVSGSIADAREARARTLAALNGGAGLVNYVGHSDAWQWAMTDPAVTPSYLLGLYDVDAPANGDRLPIVLEMTCLTSAFQQPAYSGTTIDERLVLHPHGGAIATWGPTGLGIAHGHDALQRGFYRALWSTPAGTATLGEPYAGGYRYQRVPNAGHRVVDDCRATIALIQRMAETPLTEEVVREQRLSASAKYIPQRSGHLLHRVDRHAGHRSRLADRQPRIVVEHGQHPLTGRPGQKHLDALRSSWPAHVNTSFAGLHHPCRNSRRPLPCSLL